MSDASSSNAGFVPEIEQFVLGSLLGGKGLPFVRGFLRDEHFIHDVHRRIFMAMCAAYDQSGATHLPLVRSLCPPGMDDAVKGFAGRDLNQYLADLVGDALYDGSNAANMTRAGQAVVEQHARIRLADRMESAAIAARDPAASVTKVIQATGNDLEDISASLRAARFTRSRMTIGEAGRLVYDLAEEAMRNGSGLTGVTWGLTDVDRWTGGMQRKDMILIGARPSMGKTSYMTSTALGAASAGHGIGILSLEMDGAKLTARAISDLAHRRNHPLPYVDILRGNLPGDGLDIIANASADLDALPIEIDEAPVGTFDIRMKIEGMLERFEKKGWPRLDALMVDHLGFIRASDHYRGNRNNEVGEITRALKDFAKEYDVAVVLLSQLSRAVTQRENKRPILADLRDSGNIEQDADMVAFLHREAYYLERLEEEGDAEFEREAKLEACRHEMEFIIAKQRNGPVRTVSLWCDMAFSAVRNAARYDMESGR